MSSEQCCGNFGLKYATDCVMQCNWVDEFIRSGGKLPFLLITSGNMVYDDEGTDCQTWQKKEG